MNEEQILNSESVNSTKPASPVKKINTRELVVIGMLSAITMLLGITGFGFIPLPFMKATILQVPAIIGGLIEGPRVGAMVGFMFGSFSIYQNIVMPSIMSFAFLNPLISILPRILIGPFAYLIYKILPINNRILKLSISAFMGSICNTIGVLGMIYIVYAKEYALVRNIDVDHVFNILMGVAIVNGVPEAIVSALVVTPIVYMVGKIIYKK